jgi:hypothetical protein
VDVCIAMFASEEGGIGQRFSPKNGVSDLPSEFSRLELSELPA